MKKYLAIIAAFAVLASYQATAQVTQTSETIDVMINDLDFKGKVIEQVNKVNADIGSLASAANSLVVVDTNANVVVTTKTPAFIGQVLITPNSTNVWTDAAVGATNSYLLRASVAFGATTNDWAKIATDK